MEQRNIIKSATASEGAAVARAAGRQAFSVAVNTPQMQKLINNTIADPRERGSFVTSLVSAVAQNPSLKDCDPATIVSAALVGKALNLPPSPQLGYFYMVPFEDRRNGRKTAQFQIGYKGMIQLAMRSGFYRRLNALPLKAGELKRYDPLEETVEVEIIQDDMARAKAETTGYYAFFEYLNGFRKCIYWSKARVEAHAIQFSQGYKAKKGYTFWEKSFDDMACKTLLRQLLGKWGLMSTELQKAFESEVAPDADETSAIVVGKAPAALPPPESPAPEAETAPAPQEQEGETIQADFEYPESDEG